MARRLRRASSRFDLNYSLLATPAEGLAGKFVEEDRHRFGVIEGVTDRLFYTNSFHVPVYERISIREKLRIEAPYHALCDAGHISYVEVDGIVSQNPQAIEQIVRLMAHFNLGYGSINHPINRCMRCAYEGVRSRTARVVAKRIRLNGFVASQDIWSGRWNDGMRQNVRKNRLG